MDIKQAARQAIAENWSIFQHVDTETEEIATEMILRAFTLAGYGWRPISEARKDGTEYIVTDGMADGHTFRACFNEAIGKWCYPPELMAEIGDHQSIWFEPIFFRELVSPFPPPMRGNRITWRPISEAGSEYERYRVANFETGQEEVPVWRGECGEWLYDDLGCSEPLYFEPTHFHELPPCPPKE